MKKKLLLLFIGLLIAGSLLFASARSSYSATCDPTLDPSSLSQSQRDEQTAACNPVRDSLAQQHNQVSSEIQLMDTKIYLAGLQIQETEASITKTQDDITNLEGRIDNLNTSLDHLSKVLLQKIAESYKRREVPFFDIFLDSDNASTLVNRLKYARQTEENDQHVAFQVQQAKTNFEEQKTLRQQKEDELTKLQAALEGQKADLKNQQVAKEQFLASIQNSQSQLNRFLAQLAAFKTFVANSGAGSIIGANAFGGGSDGAYYSQRDERWASQSIGNSSENVLNVGCLLTSVAMALKHAGVDTSPGAIASNASYFVGNTAYMLYRWNLNPWPNGLNSHQLSYGDIDGQLASNHYVVVGVNGCSHFVALIKKDGDDYIMHDPLYGPDLKFSSHYSGFCGAEAFN